ncbi:MAG: twin-arginine translocation signal domain-containing protein [Pyrinomonadaceae bacterium]
MSKRSQYLTSRRDFLKSSSTAIAAGLFGLGLRAEAMTNHRVAVIDEANVHNMLIVGQETVFLSHLPMFVAPNFDSPHRYQVILEASFTKAGANPQAVYANDRKSNPATKIYTLNPDEFILPDINSTNAPLSSFTANIFRGHFEKPGKRILVRGANVNIKNVVHFREFDAQAASPAQLEYILFGKGKELFLAHFITRPPDFDQVLSVSVLDHSFTDRELGKGMRLVFERPNSIAQRFTEKQEAVGEVRDANAAASPLKVRVKAGSEFYFEEGELRVPAVFGQTSAERKAGFK